MPKKHKRITEKSGSLPGTLVHVGAVYKEKTHIRSIRFNKERVETFTADEIGGLPTAAADESYITWVEVNGLTEPDLIENVGRRFGIHPLVLEDVMNTTHRPKFEEFDDYLFMVFRAPFMSGDDVAFEQVSLLLGGDWVVSFLETDRPLFEPVRERILTGKGRLRSMGADYCAYSLLDLIVDSFFDALEQVGDTIEDLDERLVRHPDPVLLKEIHRMKRTLLYIHKASWPAREVIGSLERCDSNFCSAAVGPYLRDVYDHIIQVIDTVETYRDIVSGMLDTYLSSISYRLNEIMKVLTIISTIFIPLTFLAGVYGMNFDVLPELHWPNGYFMLWGLMLSIAGLMLIYFYRRGWLWSKR